MCQEFCSQGDLPRCMLGYLLGPDAGIPLGPEAGDPKDQRQAHPPGADPSGTRSRHPRPCRSACWEIRATSGQYASYWNEILFLNESGAEYLGKCFMIVYLKIIDAIRDSVNVTTSLLDLILEHPIRSELLTFRIRYGSSSKPVCYVNGAICKYSLVFRSEQLLVIFGNIAQIRVIHLY